MCARGRRVRGGAGSHSLCGRADVSCHVGGGGGVPRRKSCGSRWTDGKTARRARRATRMSSPLRTRPSGRRAPRRRDSRTFIARDPPAADGSSSTPDALPNLLAAHPLAHSGTFADGPRHAHARHPGEWPASTPVSPHGRPRRGDPRRGISRTEHPNTLPQRYSAAA